MHQITKLMATEQLAAVAALDCLVLLAFRSGNLWQNRLTPHHRPGGTLAITLASSNKPAAEGRCPESQGIRTRVGEGGLAGYRKIGKVGLENFL